MTAWQYNWQFEQLVSIRAFQYILVWIIHFEIVCQYYWLVLCLCFIVIFGCTYFTLYELIVHLLHKYLSGIVE